MLAADLDEDDEIEEEFDRMHPPMELDDATFPDIIVSFDSDKEYDNNVGYHHGAGKTEAQDNDVILVGVRTASTDIQLCSQTCFLKLSKRMFLILCILRHQRQHLPAQSYNDGFPMDWPNSSQRTSGNFPCIGIFEVHAPRGMGQ